MRSRKLAPGLAALIVGVSAGKLLAIITLLNGSFEFGPGPNSPDPFLAANWTEFGPTVERSDEANLTPPGLGHALKAFASDPTVGAYQDVNAAPGNAVLITGNLYTRASDHIGGAADAGIVLEFYDAANNLLSSGEIFPLNASSPADTWIPAMVGPLTAPAGTTKARYVCSWRTNGAASGSAYWDGCTLSINGGANLLINGNFETAAAGTQSPFGLDDWIGFNDQAKSAEIAYDGNFSVRLGPGAAFSGVFQDFGTLQAGDRVCLTARGITRSSNPLTGSAQVGIKLEFFSATMVPPPVETFPFNDSSPADVWVPVELNLTVPANITIARIVCIYNSNFFATGAVYYDSASAIRGSNPGNNVLLNPSFESGFGGVNGIDFCTEFNTPGQSSAQLSIGEVPAFDGVRTMKATGTAIAGIYQEIQVTPGETLDVSVYMRTPSTNHIMNSAAGLKVEWFPGTIPQNIEQFTLNAGSPHDVWIPLKIDFTMPPNTGAGARFTNIYARGANGAGHAFIDACNVVVDAGDGDQDDDVDLRDFAVFQSCFSPTQPYTGFLCARMDSDCDDDIDLIDYDAFHAALGGP
jgi:hypothetical protein